jgi:hypothetical protein
MDSARPSMRSGGFLLNMLLCCAGKVLDVQGAIGICGDASDAAFPLNHHGSAVGADVTHALSG